MINGLALLCVAQRLCVLCGSKGFKGLVLAVKKRFLRDLFTTENTEFTEIDVRE